MCNKACLNATEKIDKRLVPNEQTVLVLILLDSNVLCIYKISIRKLSLLKLTHVRLIITKEKVNKPSSRC